MSDPPPGYNPNVSLLQGGTADIVPVMGGGGLGLDAPSGYNPNNSLLDGGTTVPIERVMGGGGTTSGTKGVLEVYRVKEEGLRGDRKKDREQFFGELRANIQTDTWKRTMRRLIQKYREQQSRIWTLSRFRGRAMRLPTREKTASVKPGQSVLYDKLVQFLPKRTHTIIIIPPIRGDVKQCILFLESLWDMGIFESTPKEFTLKEGYVLVAQAPFYDSSAIAGGAKEPEQFRNDVFSLFYIFLKLVVENAGQFFALAEHTPENLIIGNTLFQEFPELIDTLDDTNNILYNFLQPSYLVYPHQTSGWKGVVLAADAFVPKQPSGIEPSLPTVLSTKSADAVKGLILAPSRTPTQEILDEYLQFPSKAVEKENISLTPDPACAELATRLQLEELPAMTFTTSAGLRDAISILRLHLAGDEVPLCVDKTLRGVYKREQYAKEADNVAVRAFRTVIAGQSVEIRIPTARNGVFQEWKSGVFTKGEREFLDRMNFRDEILEAVFTQPGDRPYLDELAFFLRNLVSSECFSDVSILTKSECSISRTFLNRVFEYFVANNLTSEIMAEQDIQKLQNERLRVERKKLIEAELEQPKVIPALVDVPNADHFGRVKKEWGQPQVTAPDENGDRYVYMILVDTKKQEYLFKKLRLTNTDVATASPDTVAKQKIEEMKDKYKNYIFIY